MNTRELNSLCVVTLLQRNTVLLLVTAMGAGTEHTQWGETITELRFTRTLNCFPFMASRKAAGLFYTRNTAGCKFSPSNLFIKNKPITFHVLFFVLL